MTSAKDSDAFRSWDVRFACLVMEDLDDLASQVERRVTDRDAASAIPDTLEEFQADDLELTTRDLGDDPGCQPPPTSGTWWWSRSHRRGTTRLARCR